MPAAPFVTLVMESQEDADHDRYLAIAVELAEFGPVTFDVPVDVDLDDLVGGQKAITDPLLERIGVDRRAEVICV